MSYPPISSHAVDYVPAPAWNWDSPLTRTPHFCRAHCDRWHIRHWKEPLCVIRHSRMCPAEHGTIHRADPCRHPTVHSRKLGDTASHWSLSLCGLALLPVAYQALTNVSVSTSLRNVQWSGNRCTCFQARCFLPLRSLSLTLSRVNARFSQPSSVALRGGALLNRSRNAAITWDMVCPVCCLSCTNTLATKRSSIEKLLVSVIRKTQLNSVAATNHVCTILHSCQTTILHCTACWAVLSKRILSLRCVLSGVWWLLAHPVYIYIYIY